MSAKLIVIVGPMNTGKTLAAEGIASKFRAIFKRAEVVNDPLLPRRLRAPLRPPAEVEAALARNDVVIVTSSDNRVLSVCPKPDVVMLTSGSLS